MFLIGFLTATISNSNTLLDKAQSNTVTNRGLRNPIPSDKTEVYVIQYRVTIQRFV